MAPIRPGPHGGGGTSRARVERLIFIFLFMVVVVSKLAFPGQKSDLARVRRGVSASRTNFVFFFFFFPTKNPKTCEARTAAKISADREVEPSSKHGRGRRGKAHNRRVPGLE